MQLEEAAASSRKKRLRAAAGIFAAVLVILTLAGNTLQALTMPKIYTAEASRGELVHLYQGVATVLPAEVRDVVHPSGWTAVKVLVTEGERVHKGQKLAEYDDSAATAQLEESYSALAKLQLSMKGLELAYKLAYQGEDETAKLQAKLAIDMAKLDIADQERRIGLLEKETKERRYLLAPFEGLVLSVGAQEGLAGGSGSPDFRVTDASKGFVAELAVPASVAALLEEGETIGLSLSGGDRREIAGRVAAAPPVYSGDADGSGEENPVTVKLLLNDKTLRGGERVDASIRKSKQAESLLIPKEAVHQDMEGAFVYTLEEKPGSFGNAYYAVRTAVVIADSNATTAAVSSGLFERQQLIVAGSEPIMDGMRVRF